MLPTLAERLREQHAKSRGRKPSHPPWPVPGDPPTALLFQTSVGRASPPGPDLPAVTTLPAVMEIGVMEIETPELPTLELEPPAPAPSGTPTQRTLLAEMLVLLVWAVLVVIDGALALASLLRLFYSSWMQCCAVALNAWGDDLQGRGCADSGMASVSGSFLV